MSPKDVKGVLTTPQAELILESAIPKSKETFSKNHREIILYLIKCGWRSGYFSALERAVVNLKEEENFNGATIVQRLR